MVGYFPDSPRRSFRDERFAGSNKFNKNIFRKIVIRRIKMGVSSKTV
jgi:hypothetical protein